MNAMMRHFDEMRTNCGDKYEEINNKTKIHAIKKQKGNIYYIRLWVEILNLIKSNEKCKYLVLKFCVWKVCGQKAKEDFQYI